MSNQTLIAVLGLLGGFVGIVSSLFMTRAATRTLSEEGARNGLVILQNLVLQVEADRAKAASEAGDASQPAPANNDSKGRSTAERIGETVAKVDADLVEEIVSKGKESRFDMKWGSILLVIAFALLVAQSIATFWGAPSIH